MLPKACFFSFLMLRAKTRFFWQNAMDTLGIEPRASRMLSGCDATTPCAPLWKVLCVFEGRRARGGAATRANFHPGSGWFRPCLGFGFGAFRAPSARLPRAFRRKTPRKARPAGFRAFVRACPCQLGPPEGARSRCANCAGTGPAARSPQGRRPTARRAASAHHAGLPTSQSRRPPWPARPKRPLGLRKAPDATCSAPGQSFRRETRAPAARGFGFCSGPILLPSRIPSDGLWFRPSRRGEIENPAQRPSFCECFARKRNFGPKTSWTHWGLNPGPPAC